VWAVCVRRSASGEELRQRLAEDGYLYLPQMFPREAVLAAQERMTEQMSDFLLPGGGERTLSPDAKVRVPWPTGWLQEQPEVMRVVEGEELFDMFARLFDEPASTFDYKWFRAVGPGGSSAFHFDGIYMKCALSASFSVFVHDIEILGSPPLRETTNVLSTVQSRWRARARIRGRRDRRAAAHRLGAVVRCADRRVRNRSRRGVTSATWFRWTS
jgi:hypothetical protein